MYVVIVVHLVCIRAYAHVCVHGTCRHTATVITRSPCHLILVDRAAYMRTVRIRSQITGIDDLTVLLSKIKVFSTLSRPQLSKIAYQMREHKFKRNEELYFQGRCTHARACVCMCVCVCQTRPCLGAHVCVYVYVFGLQETPRRTST
jgi:hypothetical protein